MTYLDWLRLAVARKLRYSKVDFRTPHSLAEDLGVAECDVRWALYYWQMQGKVRQPIVADRRYDDWWRWSERGQTWREKWQRFLAYAGTDFTRLREDSLTYGPLRGSCG